MEKRNNKPDNDKQKPGGNKFNSYWIYGALALLLLALNFWTLQTSNEQLIDNWHQVAQMVKDQDVKKIEVINEEVANIYLKDEVLKNEAVTH